MDTPTARPWLAQYPDGVGADIEPGGWTSLVDLLDASFERHARREQLLFMGHALRYADVDAQSRAIGAWLQSLGLKPGTRVALMLPNVPQMVVSLAAVLRAGYVVVNVNPLYTPRELAHQLVDSGAEAIVILENFANTLAAVIEQTRVRHVLLTQLGDALPAVKRLLVNTVVRHVKKLVPPWTLPERTGHTLARWPQALKAGASLPWRSAAPRPDDLAFLQYTGGTTGVSKGAMLQHRHVLANIAQCESWFSPATRGHEDEQLTGVCALPLYHIFALTICFMLGARLGQRMLLVPNARDIPGTIKTLASVRFHLFPAVNTLYNALLDHPDIKQVDFSGLVISMGGGMAVQQATAQRWLALTGCPIVEGYGLSETSPVACANRVDVRDYTGTVGYPMPSTEIAIRDDDGHDVAIGESGEICIRGPQVMAGYWQRPDETALAMDAAGWFRSGDIGVMDARGQVRIVDRKKDMILVSGFNVYPTEIEQVVNLMPGVTDCAAVGMPDERTGEAVRLCIVRRDPQLTAEDVAAWCREQLTAYKRPKVIEFHATLPKTNVGKILRRELRDSPLQGS
ncbi:AMP-binding protein [Leptothrix discophora]|uniref:Long-chain-fatty-acid--CoA ligase n=1 Tax=Leptothrix discophora TaxID=89 RepID=A0ABT9G5T0_LEPDI|nr:AMP-binding protein [Leptothrix discophora]MDP4301819.1 AMP-binding protein [Leptothrix discophora]